ncbi:hypothetical protein GGF32_005864 [Allomyces javanicus]|nr:hypothetical protein GGF32_005864 [Allomyces javanicus]
MLVAQLFKWTLLVWLVIVLLGIYKNKVYSQHAAPHTKDWFDFARADSHCTTVVVAVPATMAEHDEGLFVGSHTVRLRRALVDNAATSVLTAMFNDAVVLNSYVAPQFAIALMFIVHENFRRCTAGMDGARELPLLLRRVDGLTAGCGSNLFQAILSNITITKNGDDVLLPSAMEGANPTSVQAHFDTSLLDLFDECFDGHCPQGNRSNGRAHTLNELAVTMHQNYDTMFKGIFPDWRNDGSVQYPWPALPEDPTDLLTIRALATAIWTKRKKDHKEAYLCTAARCAVKYDHKLTSCAAMVELAKPALVPQVVPARPMPHHRLTPDGPFPTPQVVPVPTMTALTMTWPESRYLRSKGTMAGFVGADDLDTRHVRSHESRREEARQDGPGEVERKRAEARLRRSPGPNPPPTPEQVRVQQEYQAQKEEEKRTRRQQARPVATEPELPDPDRLPDAEYRERAIDHIALIIETLVETRAESEHARVTQPQNCWLQLISVVESLDLARQHVAMIDAGEPLPCLPAIHGHEIRALITPTPAWSPWWAPTRRFVNITKGFLLAAIGRAKGDKVGDPVDPVRPPIISRNLLERAMRENEALGKQHTAQEVVDALRSLRNAVKMIGVQAVLKPEYHVLPPAGMLHGPSREWCAKLQTKTSFSTNGYTALRIVPENGANAAAIAASLRDAAQHNQLLETYVKKSQHAQAAPNQMGKWWTVSKGMMHEKRGRVERSRCMDKFRSARPALRRFNANMPAFKTLDLAALRDACQYVTTWMPIIMPMVLSNSLASHEFRAANAERAFYDRLAAKLMHSPDPTRPALVCFGNAGHLNSRGVSAPVRKFLRYLAHAGARVVLLDEWKTSKTCSLCGSDMPNDRRRWGSKRCRTCKRIRARDRNACLKLVRVAVRDALDVPFPQHWRDRGHPLCERAPNVIGLPVAGGA